MKNKKKILAVTLSMLAACTLVMPVFASDSSQKEEVIYVTANADGTVNNINAVNIFEGGDITDYGDYESVKMLTTTDKITQSGDKIMFSSNSDKVYYQGTMKEVELPWLISLHYYIDGKEYTSDKLAGKNGKLEIKISITKNDKCVGNYFDDYALQVLLTLDTDLCKNIKTDGATTVNIGSDKQFTYTILPGKGLETSIQANVKEFEMDAISINGIKLNLNMDINDEELTEKVNDLMDATQKLNDGAETLFSGTEPLKTGGDSLSQGISSLHSGVNELDNGISSLQTGISSMQSGLDVLNSRSSSLTDGSSQVKSALITIQSTLNSVTVSVEQLEELTSASSEIKNGIMELSNSIESLKNSIGYAQYKSLMSQNGLDIDRLKSGNEQGINIIQTQISSLENILSSIENIGGYETQVAEIKAQIENLENISQLLSANNSAIAGTETYLNAISESVDKLYEGIVTLNTKYEEFDIAILELANTLNGLITKMSELTSGINQLVSKYEQLDTGINEYTEGVAAIVSSYRQLVNGISSLASGSKVLLEGTDKLSSGSAELYDGIVSLCNGAFDLSNGTNELNSQTSTMDKELQSQIDEILSSIEGEKTETVSFVSGKNTDVDSVQFVIKTTAIEEEKSEEIIEKPKSAQSFWRKLIQLFDLP